VRRPEARRLLTALAVALTLAVAGAQGADPAYGERFDRAWRLVAERYWGLDRTGVDWDAVGAEYRPRALAAPDEAAFYQVLVEMYEQLADDHSVFVPPDRVEEIRESYGALPCIALFAQRLPALTERGRLVNVTYGLTSEGVGYLRVPDLATGGVGAAVRSAVERLSDAGAWAFVLDLRGNPGGRLVTMMEVAGVFTSGFLWRAVLSWSLPVPYPAIGEPATDLPLYVLVDGDVHSAAEGLAGALQENGRATVVGERTAGNVEAVLPFCLRDGSQAWIATGVLAPLLGATWEGRGVEPDVAVPGADALAAVLTRLEEGQ